MSELKFKHDLRSATFINFNGGVRIVVRDNFNSENIVLSTEERAKLIKFLTSEEY